jgi:hypothetical protein
MYMPYPLQTKALRFRLDGLRYCFANYHIIPFSSSRTFAINPVNKLHARNLTLLQLVHSIKHALKTFRTNLGGMHSELLARKKLRSQFPERLRKFKVLWLCRHVHTASPFESFAGESVAESSLRKVSVIVIERVEGIREWMNG